MMKPMSITYSRFIEWAAALILIAYPSLMFAVKGGMNGSFLLLLILALAVLLHRPRQMPAVVWDAEMTRYLLAMASLSIAIFISQSYFGHYSGHPYDSASRFLLAVSVFLLLTRMRLNMVMMVQYGFPLATLVGLLMANTLVDGRLLLDNLDLIHFGDFELMLGVLSLLSINWAGRDPLVLRMFKILGFIVGVYVSLKTGSRGGWVAFPIFVLIFMRYRFGRFSPRTIAITLMTASILTLPFYLFNQTIHDRINQIEKDFVAYYDGDLDTDTGIRLQLYKAATRIFIKNPVFGVGPEGFRREMDSMLQAGEITPNAALLGRGEVHNEILSKAAELGIFGLIAIFLVYLVPFRIFYRALCSSSAQVRHSGMMGLVFVSGFIVFGLTAEILNLTMAAAFYSLTVAVLLAACLNIHHGEQRSPDTL